MRLDSPRQPGFERLLQLSEREGFRFLGRLLDEWASAENRFDHPGEGLWGLFKDGSLIAIGGMTARGETGRLRRFYVHPDYRRKGLGTRLLRIVLNHARTHFSQVELRTDTAVAAAFYERNGFRVAPAEARTHLLEQWDVPQTLVFPIRGEKLSVNVQVTDHVHHAKSPFQEIDIYDSEIFGRILLLDGHIQLTEFDEHAYHEALVQIPLMALTDPKRALVVGGGDGGVVRELCRSTTLERIDLVEIDEMVIQSVGEHMPSLQDGCLSDPRINVHVADAFRFVKQASELYDLIVVDSTDTYEGETGSLSEMLFTHEFYSDCRSVLTPSGIVVTQADNLVFCPYSLASITQLFDSVFSKTGSYQAIVPSFGGFSGFVWGSQTGTAKTEFKPNPGFRYLNEETYRLAFSRLAFG